VGKKGFAVALLCGLFSGVFGLAALERLTM
jgi:hypothetical protein